LGFVPRIKWETGDFGAVCCALQVKQEILGLCVMIQTGNGSSGLRIVCHIGKKEFLYLPGEYRRKR